MTLYKTVARARVYMCIVSFAYLRIPEAQQHFEYQRYREDVRQ